MNTTNILNRLKEDYRYFLEYDYCLQSNLDVELFEIDDILCILRKKEMYCMVTKYDRKMLNNLISTIRDKAIQGNKIFLNFNVDQNIDDEIEYLKTNEYTFHSVYDSYIFRPICDSNHIAALNENVVELTTANINCYKYDDVDVKIKFRPSFQILTDAFLCENRGHLIAYVRDNRILGYLSHINIFDNVNDVDYIYVAEQYRNSGIGTALGKYYARKSIDAKNIALWSNAANPASAQAAINAGFEWCCKHMSFSKELL